MTAAKLERTRKSLVKDFGDVLAEAESLLKQAAAETGDRASDLRSQVEAKLLAAKSKLSDLQDDAVDRAKALSEDRRFRAIRCEKERDLRSVCSHDELLHDLH